MDTPASGVLRWRKPVYIVLATLTFAMLVMSFVEVWVLLSAPDPAGFGSIQASSVGLPGESNRGAFLTLNPGHDPAYAGNLVQLLATTEPGVINPSNAAHFQPKDLKEVLVQSATISLETGDYRVTIIGDPGDYPMSYTRDAGGKVLRIRPKSGTWKPGAYMADIPSEGMFGGRTYFQFYIDAPKNKP